MMTIPILALSVLECFIRAFHHANGFFSSCTEVAFRSGLLAVQIPLDSAIRANHETHPASDALLLVVKDGTCFLIPVKGPAHAGFEAIRFFTMATLHAERKRPLFLHMDSGKGPGLFLLESLKNVFGL
jgi:hypothetical protein